MHLLVIDDEPLIVESIRAAFGEDEVHGFGTAREGIEHFVTRSPDVVLCDLRLPDMSGMEAFDKLHRIDHRVPIIMMTGFGTSATAIEAMRQGAFEYVLKPLNVDHLSRVLESAEEANRMMRATTIVPQDDNSERVEPGVDAIIGRCPAMQEVYRSIGRVAKQDVTVLILGESGTGKEVIARALYQYSSRPDGRFLALNCAAIPEPLLESELFGHEKGAFTGAETRRIGKFELCDDGTLFLDEIGDMSPLMQTKLLRVLQDQTFERVGGTQTIHTNARLIAATNRDLSSAIESKEFRSDLYYRLNVYTIHLPPLRERGDDILLLAIYFARKFAKELKKEFSGFSDSALKLLREYAWPGNVRELQSVIKRSLLEATGSVIIPAMIPLVPNTEASIPSDAFAKNSQAPLAPIDFATLTHTALQSGSEEIYRELISLAEAQVLQTVLNFTAGNISDAARRLGITRNTLRSKCAALKLSVENAKTSE